jgi:hypothetical protein
MLYQMVSGKPPFESSTLAGLGAAISQGTYPALPPEVPTRMQRLVDRCLEKDPARRPADADAVLEELDAPPVASVKSGVRLAVGLGAVLLLTMGIVWFWHGGSPLPDAQPAQLVPEPRAEKAREPPAEVGAPAVQAPEPSPAPTKGPDVKAPSTHHKKQRPLAKQGADDEDALLRERR